MLVVMRRLWIRTGTFNEFERISRERIWPSAEAAGLRIFGLFRAHDPDPHPRVSEPCDMAVLFTQYTDRAHMAATQADSDNFRGPSELRRRIFSGIERRRQLTLAVDQTPMTPVHVPIGGPFFQFDHREPSAFDAESMRLTASDGREDWGQTALASTLVVIRRFWIQHGEFEAFERLSREEIWPPIESAGARIRGMFRAESPHPNDAVNEPCDMVVLCTQYVDRAHWQATRPRPETWKGPEDVRQQLATGGRARHRLTLATQPIFTEPAHVPIGGPFRTWQ